MSIGAAVGGLVAGRLADRLPAGPIAAFGTAVLGLGMILLSMQSSLEAMLAIYLAIGLLGFSCLYAPLLAATARWFPGRGGLAFGIVTAGGALGQAVIPTAAAALDPGVRLARGLCADGLRLPRRACPGHVAGLRAGGCGVRRPEL
jgi:MFS family permease